MDGTLARCDFDDGVAKEHIAVARAHWRAAMILRAAKKEAERGIKYSAENKGARHAKQIFSGSYG